MNFNKLLAFEHMCFDVPFRGDYPSKGFDKTAPELEEAFDDSSSGETTLPSYRNGGTTLPSYRYGGTTLPSYRRNGKTLP